MIQNFVKYERGCVAKLFDTDELEVPGFFASLRMTEMSYGKI